ncbi:MAG: LysR family transcriptional regulator [Rubrobacteraceae bacterium]|uniref:LysR family transcriptional regulator n=1 Tax=Rubrobacter naiadicus TaxID=1392641 RepID=UPI00236308FB|nr:LysR family transcriptional regulator [Rubrobacter naiadicus]MBX6764047.1 LysR family transcriptional regulator [Rubrobacteraceae bacterium]MCL6438188.1 LysR family transcriptional regulator [Rubrobacteraceae bacterium]
MELRHLQYFVAVAEEMSISRAAQRLHMAQPPLSNQIKQLESELGVLLFERTSRGVRLTEAGEMLLEEARRFFIQLDQAVRVVQRVGHGEVGRLALGFVPSASNEILPEILHSFRELYPGVELFLSEMKPDQIVQQLHEGKIDAGFLYLPLEDPSLSIERVSREPLVLALPERHPLAPEPEVDLREVAHEPFILPMRYRLMPGLHGQVTEACRRAGFVPNAVQKDVWLMQTIVGLVAGGLGVALVPASVQNLSRKGVLYKRVSGLSPSVELGFVWPPARSSPVLEAFLAVVRENSHDPVGAQPHLE